MKRLPFQRRSSQNNKTMGFVRWLLLLCILQYPIKTASTQATSCVAKDHLAAIDPESFNNGSRELKFKDAHTWCTYHCDPFIRRKPHFKCNTRCTCRRLLNAQTRQTIRSVEFIYCGSDVIKINEGLQSHRFFHGFYHDIINAYQRILDAVVMANGSVSVEETCHLPLLSKRSTSRIIDDFPRPYIMYVSRLLLAQFRQLSELKAMRVLSQTENGIIVLAHLSPSAAQRINSFELGINVIQIAPIMKIIPLARSLRFFESRTGRTPSPDEIPKIRVHLASESAKHVVLKQLNQEILSECGLKSSLSWYGADIKTVDLVLPPMDHVGMWAKVLSLLIVNPVVEWVDLDDPLQLFVHPPLSLFSTRRLDDFVEDVLKTTLAKSNGIRGQGTVVGITDTGLYIDHDQFDQESRNMYDRIDQGARKVILYDTFGDNTDQSETILCGHGTHVSGIIAGKSFTGTMADLGIAPDAKIAFKDIGTQRESCVASTGCTVNLQTPFRSSELFGSQSNARAKVYSFSWGTLESDYSSQARDIDEYLFEHDDILVVVAAGNSGSEGSMTISSPAGAKNVITVGASLNSAASFGNSGCSAILNEGSVAGFSSIGPTTDGRMKPDIVAPGQIISSAQSEIPGSTDKSTATCQLQGTSQSTPAVAGLALLTYQWLRDGFWKNGVADPNYKMTQIPSALIKALLIHSAESLQRRVETISGTCAAIRSKAVPVNFPDMNQGYGLPQFSNIASFETNEDSKGTKVHFLPNSEEEVPIIDEGGVHEYNFTIKPSEVLRVTLVWTDPAGSLNADRMLQHDLDLSVFIPGSSRLFHSLSGNGNFDRKNNVEMVQVTYEELVEESRKMNQNSSDFAAGSNIIITARIHGFSILAGSQPYAMVTSSGSIGSSKIAGKPGSSFVWKPWMTITASVIGGLLISLALWCCLSRRRRHAASNNSFYVDSTASYGVANFANLHVQRSDDGCPYCLYFTADPVALVHHVESVHQNIAAAPTTSIDSVIPNASQRQVPVRGYPLRQYNDVGMGVPV